MMRLINADELKENFQDNLCKGIACDECSMQAGGFCRVERWIDIAPTIEIDQKHGRWNTQILDGIMGNRPQVIFCDKCGQITFAKTNYCPNCGAKMSIDGKDGGENGQDND